MGGWDVAEVDAILEFLDQQDIARQTQSIAGVFKNAIQWTSGACARGAGHRHGFGSIFMWIFMFEAAGRHVSWEVTAGSDWTGFRRALSPKSHRAGRPSARSSSRNR